MKRAFCSAFGEYEIGSEQSQPMICAEADPLDAQPDEHSCYERAGPTQMAECGGLVWGPPSLEPFEPDPLRDQVLHSKTLVLEAAPTPCVPVVNRRMIPRSVVNRSQSQQLHGARTS